MRECDCSGGVLRAHISHFVPDEFFLAMAKGAIVSVKVKIPNIGTIKVGFKHGISFKGATQVQGYYRQDGTYVRGHFRAQ